MDAGRILREARRRAGLTQSQLAAKAGMAQPAIARIERGGAIPRVDTLDRLLEACGRGLYVRDRIGMGVDRSMAYQLRRHSVPERSRVAEEEAPYSAAPAEFVPTWKPLHALEALVRNGVRFVLIGGYAARLHGSPTVTNDTDVCYARDEENIERLVAALGEVEAYPRGAPAALPFVLDVLTIRNGQNFTFMTTGGALDCLGFPAGTEGFDDLERTSVDVDLGAFTVRCATVEDLIRMKLATGRAKDRIEVEVLGALQEVIDEEEAHTNRRPPKNP